MVVKPPTANGYGKHGNDLLNAPNSSGGSGKHIRTRVARTQSSEAGPLLSSKPWDRGKDFGMLGSE